MRIAQVSPYFWPHRGGVESHVANLGRELATRGHDVTVFTSLTGDDPLEETLESGLKVIRIKPRVAAMSSPYNPRLHRVLKRAHRDRPFDIIHAHTPPPLESFYASKVTRKSKVPLVVTYHCDLYLPGILGRIAVPIYRRLYERRTVKRTNKFIVTTKDYGATSKAMWNTDPVVIPNAVDHLEFHPGVKENGLRAELGLNDEPVALYVGRLAYHKGLKWLVKSAAFCADNVRVVLVGDGPERGKLERIARSDGVQDKVIFAGSVTNDELPAYYAMADLFVLPSISRLEAFGIVALEAQASCVPVLISDIPGVREVIEDGITGLTIEPLNPADIGKKIDRLIRNPKRRAEMGRAGRDRVELRYTWRRVATAVEAVYIDLAG